MSTKTKNTAAVSMFEQIRESLKNEKKGSNASFRNIMKFEMGNTYLVRLIPNLKNPEATFFHYFNHGWKSIATGQFVSALCPTTYGETCPIDTERFKIWRNGTEDEKKAANDIKRKENYLVNAYVISDPTNPENEGKVKMIRYGKQLHKIIDDAINGDDAEEFGAKIFDLSENGCNFRIKVEANTEGNRKWPTYVASKFLSPSAIKDMTPEKIEEIYNQVHDLEKVEERKTTAQLQEMLDVHFYNKVTPQGNSNDPDWTTSRTKKTKEPSNPTESEDDEIPGLEPVSVSEDSSTSSDQQIDELLKDL